MNKSTGIGFDALFNNASMGIVVTDGQGVIVLVNPFLLRQFGYTEQELVGAPIETLIPSRFHSKHVGHVQHYSQHPKSRPMGLGMDLFARRKDGSEFAVEVSLGSYETEQGKFTIAFLSDISQRKEAELALKQLNSELESKVEERTLSLSSTVKQLAHQIQETETKDAELKRVNSFLSNIWEHASAIIFVTDKNGIIKMFNPAAEKKLGYTAYEIVGKHTPEIFYDKNESSGRSRELPFFDGDKRQSVNSDAAPAEYEVHYVRKNGTQFPVSLTITAMRDIYGITDGYLGIAIDISERIKAETDLRMALEKEKELSELKSRFVSMASHEFRTPLSTVLSSVYLISKYTDSEDQPRREKHVQRIVSSVNLLTDVLNDFLSVGKIEEGKIQVRRTSFNVCQMIQSTINEMQGLLRSGQHIRFTYDGDAEVYLDPGLLKHIVMNLLSNAVKFSPEESDVLLDGVHKNGRLLLSFTDKGLGISEEDQQHLFERFFRGNNVSHIQGTGLGLHIVSKYAELMNGTVTCKSKPGEGTTFEVLLDTCLNENT
ncbi:PAS domain-containing sensor histidine kinase [Chitinophagaceae bacterium MMS25-I14]